jgi:hypothetical protein
MSHLKIECARRQLGTALDLYLRDRDPISVHCLANGGCELIEFYAKKAGAKPFISQILETQPKPDIKALKTVQRQYWNAFKHALEKHGDKERDDGELLSSFTDEQNDVALFIGWYDYAQATKKMPIEAQVHQLWWIALHPDKLDPKHANALTGVEKYFPGLRERARAKQKRMLKKVIERMRTNKNLMRDPRTDSRPLVLNGELWNDQH